MKKPMLPCPECGAPAAEPDFHDRALGWRWSDGMDHECPKCKVKLVVTVTDDYEEDAKASLTVVVS